MSVSRNLFIRITLQSAFFPLSRQIFLTYGIVHSLFNRTIDRTLSFALAGTHSISVFSLSFSIYLYLYFYLYLHLSVGIEIHVYRDSRTLASFQISGPPGGTNRPVTWKGLEAAIKVARASPEPSSHPRHRPASPISICSSPRK